MAIWEYFYLCYKTNLNFIIIIIIKKQLISLLVTFGPTAKGTKLLDVSILAPENLTWRCLSWGEDVENSFCFKPAVPPALAFADPSGSLSGFSGENIHLDEKHFPEHSEQGDSSGLSFITLSQ